MKRIMLALSALLISIIGSSQNPLLLKDVAPGNNSGTIQQIVKTSNYTFFNENDGGAATDRSLYRTDGTTGGTIKLNLTYLPDPPPSLNNYSSTKAEKLTVFGDKIIFAGDNIANYGEIWVSDGTQAGTVAIERFQPNSNKIPVVEIKSMGSYAYYSVVDKDAGGINHAYLRKTDGTAAGTSLVYDFSAFAGIAQVVFLTPVNNILYFIVYDQGGTGVDQLWRSDGTTAGTYMVYNFGLTQFVASYLMVAGNNMYVMIVTPGTGNVLWKSDGTAAGTVPVKTIGTSGNNNYPPFTATIGNNLVFAGLDGNGKELWVTDGTAAGTNMIADINPGAASSNPANFTFLNNVLYFSANNTTNGVELWKHDGAVASLVEDINPGSGNSNPSFLVESNGTILFQATNGITGNELWITDGSAANTKLVADINISGSSLPNLLTPGNPVYFAANDGVNGFEVFKYDNSGGIQNIKTKLYVNDNNTAGDVFTTAVGSNSNNGSAAAPYASLQYAVSQAALGATIYIDAGSYTEQVIINKGLNIIGAGQTLSFFTPPASTLVPAPGSFTEIGLFETTQGIGDVHIRDLSINSVTGNSQNIIIQSGGSVKNCTLLNGGQGIFFRIDPAIKTALIENNTIQPNGIGINCQGSGLTATIRNNTISKASSYYAGIFAGLDFGPLPQLTIQNNIINNYFGEGILAASFNGTYTLNSITGTGTNAINRNGNGGNTPIATCNWFGTSNPATIASKIIGTVIYTPFLTDGTDNSSNPGFQPVGSCGSGNTFYVNNNSTTSDVFTSAVGNNANAGTAAAPFATLQFAVNTAAANDIIYVDAGTYTEQVTITKGITIIGAGQNATSILKPATTVAPPGPFTEQGVIQTAQNIGDVNIKDLSVTGNYTVGVTPIIIQSGGSVRNCKLQNGNQGLFVRIDASTNPGAKTFYIEGNTIQAEYIAVNTAGTSLHAIVSNNTLSANNAGFSSGMWAGMDFGPLGRLTATNNLFSTYYSSGIQISASIASITQNAFTGTGALAINRTGGANITANCNWYGTATASAIVPKINAGVNYYPWYVDGTDANPVAGFQHYSESCGGGLNFLYVNDNNTTGDLFTTTTGDDANTGTPTSPLATFGAALTKASPGAVIYMDAGTYTAQDATIDKQVQVIGTNFNNSPNSAADPLLLNSTRNAETIIENTNWIIGANSIYLDGLTFNPLGKQAITLNNTTWSDTRLLRNRLRISSNLTQLNFTGSGTTTMAPSAIANWNLNIRENRFEKEDASFGLTITVSRYGGVTISNNSFVVTGTTVRTQTAIFAGPGGVVNYLYIANNTFDRASTAINSSRLAVANINFNKIINTSNAFFGFNPLIESSEVGFRYNTLDGSGGIFPFIQYTRQGGNAVGASSSFTAEENTISGTAVAGTTTILGSMNLIFFNSVLNPSLTVRNNKITFGGDLSTVAAHFIRPIMIRGNLANAVVEKNEINLIGINQQPKSIGVDLPVSPAITLYTDNGTTSFLQSGSIINILNNKINGFKHSFAAYDAASAGNDAYVGYGNIPAGVTVNINNNSFTGDSISINNGTVGQPVLATCNWYGSADAAIVVPKISGIATYSPWLTNGTDNDVATGFQPVPNVCNGRQNKFYVNDADITGDVFTTKIGDDANSGVPSSPLATITTALTRAAAGDTIYVDAGTYAEDIVVNKGITILGVQTGVNPGSLLTRGAESILVPVSAADPVTRAVVRLQASNIIIDGFTVNGDNPALTGSVTLNGVDINAGFGFAKLIEPSAHNNIIIRNNIIRNFYRYGVFLQSTAVLPLSGNLIEQNHIDNISAQNVDGNAGRTGRGVALFNNGYASVKNNVFTRNFMGILLQTNTAPSPGTYLITGNKIESYRYGMVINNLSATSNQYLVNENEITTADLNAWTVPGSSSTNNNTGLQVFGIINTAGLSFNNNKINDTWKGFWFDNITAPLTVNNNSITGTFSYAIENANGNTVTATCNWFGSAAAQNFISKLTLPTVDIVPWLTNGTDNDAATGFQPVPNSCDGYPTLITLNSSTNVTCNAAANGSIDISTTYGKAPFTYTWTKDGDANFVSNNEDLTGLAPGTYRLAIVDGNGSNIYIIDPEADGPGTITVTITEPSVLTASPSGSNVSCYGGNNGSASVTADGGTKPYTYFWSNGATTDEITNLIAGIYSVTVTDDNGCITTASYEVTQPALLTAGITNNSTACSNNAMVTAGDGTAPYSYLWSNGSTSSSITGVIAGTYSVTVTDANGCTATASVTLTVSGAFNPTAAATDVTCFGANNGTITVTNANGTAPFTFSIDGVNFLPGAFPYSFTNLAPGTYTVAARDVNGCTGFVTRTVLQPAQLVVTLTTVQSTCFGLNTGSVSVTAAGGTGALSYSWTGDGGFTSSQKNISGLATGNYSLTVTDKNVCTAILNVYVPSLTQIAVNSTVNNIACKGEINGSIILNVTGGTGNFSYLWNTGATTSSISNLNTGNYSVTVTDIGSGCVSSKSFTISQPSTVVGLSTSKSNAAGCISLGTITATGSGGTSPYQYSLDGINYQSSGSFTGLYAGSYIVRVKDSKGCIKTSAAISITDNGLDEYDGSGSNRNNTKSKAAPISTGVTIAGRIATTGDPEDWYKFTITTAGNYTLSLTHPSASFTYNLFTLNNATAIGTVGSTSTSKTYSLAAGDYYIQVTGGLSYVCYSLGVSSVAARNSSTTETGNKAPVVISSSMLKARTYPNPHNGSFMLNIESPEDGNARVELFTITGQKLVERTVLLQKGENNLVPFKGISKGTVLYRVQIGKHVATGKVIGIE